MGTHTICQAAVSPVPGNLEEDKRPDSAFGVGGSLQDDGGQWGSQGSLGCLIFHPAVTPEATGARSTFHRELEQQFAFVLRRQGARGEFSASLFPTRSFETETLLTSGLKVLAPRRQPPVEVE